MVGSWVDMKSLTRVSVLAAALLISACASYQRSVMEPWLGASESELVQMWGYGDTHRPPPTSSRPILTPRSTPIATPTVTP